MSSQHASTDPAPAAPDATSTGVSSSSAATETPASLDPAEATGSVTPALHTATQSGSASQLPTTSPKPNPTAHQAPASPTKSSHPPSRPPSQGPSHSQTSLSRRPSQLHSSRPAPLSPAPSRRASGIGIPTLGSPAATTSGGGSGSGRDRSESNASEAGLGVKLSEAISASTLGTPQSSGTAPGDGGFAGGGSTGLRRASSKAKTRPRSSLGTTVYSYATDAFHEADEGAKDDASSAPSDVEQASQRRPSTRASPSPSNEGDATSALAPASTTGQTSTPSEGQSRSRGGSGSSASGSGNGSGSSNTHNAPSDLAALPIPEAGILSTSPAMTPHLPPVPSAAPPSPMPAAPRHTAAGEVYIRDFGFPSTDDRHLGIGRPVTPTPLSATARRLSGILFRNRSESQGSAGSDSSEGRRGWTGFGFSWRGLMNRKPRTSSLSQSASAQDGEGRGKGGAAEMGMAEGERDEEYGGTRVAQSDDYAFESEDDEDDEDDDAAGHGIEGDRRSRSSAHHLGVGGTSSGLRYTPRTSRGGSRSRSRSRSRRASGIEGISEEDEDDYLFEDELDGGAEDDDDPAVEPVGLYRMAYTFEALGEHEMDVQEGQLVDVKGRGGGEGWCIAHRVRVEYDGEEVGEGEVRRRGRGVMKAAASASLTQQQLATPPESSNAHDTESTASAVSTHADPAKSPSQSPIDNVDLSAWTYDEPEEGLVPESYLEKVRGKTREFVGLLKAEAIRREDAHALAQGGQAGGGMGGKGERGDHNGAPGGDGQGGKEEVKTVAPDGISEEPADMSDLEDSDGVRSR